MYTSPIGVIQLSDFADSAIHPTSYPIGRRGMNCIPLESCFLFVLNIHDQGSTIIVKEVILY